MQLRLPVPYLFNLQLLTFNEYLHIQIKATTFNEPQRRRPPLREASALLVAWAKTTS
jgi:hypothetical protein